MNNVYVQIRKGVVVQVYIYKSTELVSLYIGYLTLNNYYYYYYYIFIMIYSIRQELIYLYPFNNTN